VNGGGIGFPYVVAGFRVYNNALRMKHVYLSTLIGLVNEGGEIAYRKTTSTMESNRKKPSSSTTYAALLPV